MKSVHWLVIGLTIFLAANTPSRCSPFPIEEPDINVSDPGIFNVQISTESPINYNSSFDYIWISGTDDNVMVVYDFVAENEAMVLDELVFTNYGETLPIDRFSLWLENDFGDLVFVQTGYPIDGLARFNLWQSNLVVDVGNIRRVYLKVDLLPDYNGSLNAMELHGALTSVRAHGLQSGVEAVNDYEENWHEMLSPTYVVYESRPYVSFEHSSSGGLLIPLPYFDLATVRLTADSHGKIRYNGLRLYLLAFCSQCETDEVNFRVVDFGSYNVLAEGRVGIRSSERNFMDIDFGEEGLYVPAGSYRLVQIQVDTTGFHRQGDFVQLNFSEHQQNINFGFGDGFEYLYYGEIVFRGGLSGPMFVY